MEASRTAVFRKLLGKDPENPMILFSLGSELFKEGREVAQKNGGLQTVREIDVFMRRLEKREAGEG